MIEISLEYHDLVALAIMYIIGSFVRGIALGLGREHKRRKEDKKQIIPRLGEK